MARTRSQTRSLKEQSPLHSNMEEKNENMNPNKRKDTPRRSRSRQKTKNAGSSLVDNDGFQTPKPIAASVLKSRSRKQVDVGTQPNSEVNVRRRSSSASQKHNQLTNRQPLEDEVDEDEEEEIHSLRRSTRTRRKSAPFNIPQEAFFGSSQTYNLQISNDEPDTHKPNHQRKAPQSPGTAKFNELRKRRMVTPFTPVTPDVFHLPGGIDRYTITPSVSRSLSFKGDIGESHAILERVSEVREEEEKGEIGKRELWRKQTTLSQVGQKEGEKKHSDSEPAIQNGSQKTVVESSKGKKMKKKKRVEQKKSSERHLGLMGLFHFFVSVIIAFLLFVFLAVYFQPNPTKSLVELQNSLSSRFDLLTDQLSHSEFLQSVSEHAVSGAVFLQEFVVSCWKQLAGFWEHHGIQV